MAARQQVLQLALITRGPDSLRSGQNTKARMRNESRAKEIQPNLHISTVRDSWRSSSGFSLALVATRESSAANAKAGRPPFPSVTPTCDKPPESLFFRTPPAPTKSIIWKPWAPASPGSTTIRTVSWTCIFVQSAATDIYKPPHPLRSALYHNNGDGTFTDVTEKAGVGGEGTLRPGSCRRRF
jgi:hypothetical protein